MFARLKFEELVWWVDPQLLSPGDPEILIAMNRLASGA